MPVELVSTFHGAYAIENGVVRFRFSAPTDPAELLERVRLRREGRRTAEEERLLESTEGLKRFTRDRRLALGGIRLETRLTPSPPLTPAEGVGGEDWRELLLRHAQEALSLAWDPSVHIDEGVRSLGDLDEVLNLLQERLESWKSRSTGGASVRPEGSLDSDPELLDARDRLAALRAQAQDGRTRLEHTLEAVTPRLAPNLSTLLGPLLAARLISKGGGLARLARLPASTIQVLGAERAFFDHLRGHAPPPRHGILFLHPDVQGAPRSVRGRIARALAGKAAIAARLDQAHRPVDPRLLSAFSARAARARAPRSPRRSSAPSRGRSPPLDRAS